MARGRKKPPARFVLDGSVTLAWYFKDEANADADAAATALAAGAAVVPAVWPLEVANALVVGERRGRSTEAQAAAFLGRLAALPIAADPQSPARVWGDTIALARRHRLSAYDASYLELAVREGVPLATLDGPLKAAATAAGVPLLTA